VDELIYASARSIAQAIRDKKVSAVDVVEAHLRRIDAVNPSLNAVVQLVPDRALAVRCHRRPSADRVWHSVRYTMSIHDSEHRLAPCQPSYASDLTGSSFTQVIAVSRITFISSMKVMQLSSGAPPLGFRAVVDSADQR